VLQALRWRPAASIGVPEPRPIQIRIGRFFVHPTSQRTAVMVADRYRRRPPNGRYRCGLVKSLLSAFRNSRS
jgi:hypothetical protein